MHSCTRRAFMKSGALGALRRRPGRHPPVPRSRRPRPGAGEPAQGADRGIPAGRGGWAQHGGAARRCRLLRRRAAAPPSRGPRPGAPTPPSISMASSASTPRSSPLKPLWDARRLAVVHACGSPDTTRSHFDAQDYMESGTPGVKATAGRLARPRRAGHAARWRLAPPGRLDGPAAPAHSPRRGGSGRDGEHRGVRREGRCPRPCRARSTRAAASSPCTSRACATSSTGPAARPSRR